MTVHSSTFLVLRWSSFRVPSFLTFAFLFNVGTLFMYQGVQRTLSDSLFVQNITSRGERGEKEVAPVSTPCMMTGFLSIWGNRLSLPDLGLHSAFTGGRVLLTKVSVIVLT